MKNINETEFEKELEKIKNSKIELKPKTQKGENKMKNIKKFNWKKLIETAKTIVIYTAVIAGLAFYFGMKQGESNTKVNNDKLVETIRNEIYHATDKGKRNIFLDVYNQDIDIEDVIEKAKKHISIKKNNDKIDSLIVVSGDKFHKIK